MPEPTPTGTNDGSLTRFQAQRRLGLFAPLDYTIVILIIFAWMTLGFWKLFGNPSILHVVAFAMLNMGLMWIWLMVLVYRVLVFILDLHADVGLMPEAAARIVIGYHQGGMAKQPTRSK